jgi:hypothetical protein
MNPLAVTLLVVLGCAGVLAAYDVYLNAQGGLANTISHRALQAARQYPVIPLVLGLAVGLLLGHLFWPQH